MSKPKKKTKKNIPKTKPAKTARLSGLPPFFTNKRLHCWLILAFSFLLYANTLPHKYTQDDAIVIYDNMYTTQGLAGIPGILKYDTFKGFFKVEGKDKLVSGGRYRPLSLVLFAIEWQLFARPATDTAGKVKKDQDGAVVYEGRPWISHFLNILWYSLTGIVLYLVLLQLFKNTRPEYKYFVALLAALLFVAHPIHTEAVANIKGRDEILALLGSLAALYFSLQAWYKKRTKYVLLAAALFFLALLSKENAITFLVVIPLAFYFFTKAKMADIVRQVLPLLGTAGIFLLIRGSVLGWSLGEPSLELMNNPFLKLEGTQYAHLSLSERLATIMFTLGKYIQLLIFPHPLTHDYYPRHVALMSWSNWQVLLSLAAYVGLILVAIKNWTKKDPVSFGILYFLLTLSIVSNIIFPVGTNMSERFMFMPSAGFCLIVSVLLYRLALRMAEGKLHHFKQLHLVLGVSALVLLLYSAKTFSRNFAWKDNFTLFRTDIFNSPNSAKLRNALGGELSTQSVLVKDESKRRSMLLEAKEHLLEAVRIHPGYQDAFVLLGNVHNYLKEYDDAIEYYGEALRMKPEDPNASGNLQITYRDAGLYFGEEKGDLQRSLRYLQKAHEMDATDYETLRLLGVAYGVSGNPTKAIDFFQKALNQNPDDADALWNLGSAYGNTGDQAKADEYFQRARAIDPEVGNRRQ